jgi:hypothetical protein
MAKTNPPNYFGYKTRQEIAAEYGISPKTLKKKLGKHDIKLPRGRICLRDQKMIYEALGYPLDVSKHDYEDI